MGKQKSRAPRPGAGRREAETSAARVYLRIRVRDEERTLAFGLIPIKERILVRKVTGLPIESFLPGNGTELGIDSLVVLWWLAGRAAGDPFLTLDQAGEDFVDIGEDDLDMTEVQPDDTDGTSTDPEL